MTAYNFKNNLSPVYMSDIYTLNSSPVVKTRRSVDSFVEPIYMKEISRKSISYLFIYFILYMYIYIFLSALL